MTISRQPPISVENLLPRQSGVDDCFNLLLLSLFYGSYFFLGTLLIYIPGGVIDHEEFSIFVLGWISIPPLTLFALAWVYKLKQTNIQSNSGFFSILLGINTAFGILATYGLYLVRHLNHSSWMLIQFMLGVLILFPLLQIFIFWSMDRFSHSRTLSNLKTLETILYWFIPFGFGIMITMFSGVFATYQGYILPLRALLFAIPFGFLAYLHRFLIGPSTTKKRIALDTFTILLIIGACFDPRFEINTVHENFYIGPINALLHGKTMLVDVYSQYGVLVIEFLAFFFRLHVLPLNYQGLAFLIAVLCMIQYSLVYFLIRTIIPSPGFALVVLCMVLLMNFFAILGYFQSYPSIGPVRFGLCYVLLAIITLRLKYPVKKSIFEWLEYGVLAIASLWSFETFIYTGAVFYGIRVYDGLATTNDIRSFFKKTTLEVLKSILVIVIFHSLKALTIFLARGTWPNWAYYFEYIYAYSVDGFGGLPVDAWSPWFVILMIYFAGLVYPFVAWIITRQWSTSPETRIVFCLALFGTAQFTYYVGRSHPNALFHICIPAILIAAYGVSRITNPDSVTPNGARYASLFLAYVTIALLGISHGANLIKKFPNTGFGFAYTVFERRLAHKDLDDEIFQELHNRLWQPKPTTSETAEAIKLIQKYASSNSRVMIFLPGKEATTEALFLSHKAHLYPVTDKVQDSLSTKVSDFIIDYPLNFQINDVIFLPANPQELLIRPSLPAADPEFIHEYPRMVVLNLCNQFSLEEIESTQSGVTALSLQSLGDGTSDYCAETKTLKNQ